jgi:DNA-dependent RNA polymerase auxiliary subunit epsilon
MSIITREEIQQAEEIGAISMLMAGRVRELLRDDELQTERIEALSEALGVYEKRINFLHEVLNEGISRRTGNYKAR